MIFLQFFSNNDRVKTYSLFLLLCDFLMTFSKNHLRPKEIQLEVALVQDNLKILLRQTKPLQFKYKKLKKLLLVQRNQWKCLKTSL